MSNLIQPQRAIVKPRIVSPESGAAVPLEDVVLSLMERQERGVVVIAGSAGSGKSTALSDLAAVLPTDRRVRFIDRVDLNTDRTELYAAESLAVAGYVIVALAAAARSIPPYVECGAFILASWTEDDWIEYLLALHPQQCGSVIKRLHSDPSLDLLGGNPELCSIVLERMARDETATSIQTVLREELMHRLEDPKRARVTTKRCDFATSLSRAITFNEGEGAREHHGKKLVNTKCDPAAIRLLRHDAVTQVVTASQITRLLERRDGRWIFEKEWPRALFRTVADSLDDTSIPALEHFAKKLSESNSANVAGLLVTKQPGWRPVCRLRSLSNAVLDGVHWSGVDLSGSSLARTSFRSAELTEANLDRAEAAFADFRYARMDSASLCGLTAPYARFDGARLANAVANRADFTRMSAEFADFSSADLVGVQFKNAKLRGANFESANLTNAFFRQADVRETIFKKAVLCGASMAGLSLRECTLDGADFTAAFLKECDLEFVDLAQPDFERAILRGAYLTGSRMPGANFHKADLRGTGLADVDWEGADLRDADLSGSTFHMGSSRSGLIDSTIASEGTRTGFYTDEYLEQSFRSPESIRKANLRGANLVGAVIDDVDFYLVDLRGAQYSDQQRRYFQSCRAILDD